MYISKVDSKIKEIENLEIVKENGKYYINLSVILDSENSVDRCKAKAILPVDTYKFSVLEKGFYSPYSGMFIDFGLGDLRCVDDKITYENIYKKEREMTISDIERKLGYKIKLVSEKEERIWKSHRNMNQDLIMI